MDAKSVTQLEIMPRPPEDRAADNPWPEWPKVYKVDYGRGEAKEVFGSDPRQYLTATRNLLVTRKKPPRACLSMKLSGNRIMVVFSPVEVPGSEREIPAQVAFA